MASDLETFPEDYAEVLAGMEERVRAARLTAQRRVNTELIRLYWSIGNTILRQQKTEGWGTQVST